MALRIMQTNYENMVRAHQAQPGPTETRVSDETKFQVVKNTFSDLEIYSSVFKTNPFDSNKCFLQFQAIIDSLFASFNASVSTSNFSELSGCVFAWLEEHCKPQVLNSTFQTIV